jgi:hypothetical protein
MTYLFVARLGNKKGGGLRALRALTHPSQDQFTAKQ